MYQSAEHGGFPLLNTWKHTPLRRLLDVWVVFLSRPLWSGGLARLAARYQDKIGLERPTMATSLWTGLERPSLAMLRPFSPLLHAYVVRGGENLRSVGEGGRFGVTGRKAKRMS